MCVCVCANIPLQERKLLQSVGTFPPVTNEKYKILPQWMWKIGIVTHNLPHPLWDAGGVSRLVCAAGEWGARGRSSSACLPPCSLPLVSLGAEWLSRNCTWAMCWDSPQLCCLSTAVHPLACMNKHATLGFRTADFSSPKKMTCEVLIVCNNLVDGNGGAEMGRWRTEPED